MQNFSYENEFDLHENERAEKTRFPLNGFARRFVLILRQLENDLLASCYQLLLAQFDFYSTFY